MVLRGLVKWLVVGLCLLGSGAASAATHALIMTIGEYQGGITQLTGAKYDAASAREIAHKLGVKDENILQLQDAQLTLAGMRAALDNFIKQVGTDDEVFIYYSGHGGRQYVSDPEERCAESLVTVDGYGYTDAELEAKLRALGSKARRIIVFLDACHSGGVTTRALGTQAGFTAKYWSKGEADECAKPSNVITRSLGAKTRSLGSGDQNYVYIAAARDDEVSLDQPGKGGVATQAWLKCVSGGAKDSDASGGLTAEEIRDCAQQKIDATLQGAKGFVPHHIKITGNANAVLALKDAGSRVSPAPAVAAAASVSPYNTLLDIYNNRDDRRVVSLKAEKSALRIGKDKVEFTLTSTHAGYVYLLMVGSDGKTFDLLFPNTLDNGNYIEAGRTLTLPASNWQVDAGGPKGTDHLLALVADSKRDFSGLGAVAAGPFSVVAASPVAAKDIQLVTHSSAAASSAACGDQSDKRSLEIRRACSDAYGAAMLSLEEIE